jgi:hypothetical protein
MEVLILKELEGNIIRTLNAPICVVRIAFRTAHFFGEVPFLVSRRYKQSWRRNKISIPYSYIVLRYI